MCDYIPTDTDVSEIGDYQDDYNNLLEKYNFLLNENENLNKKLANDIFERENKSQRERRSSRGARQSRSLE